MVLDVVRFMVSGILFFCSACICCNQFYCVCACVSLMVSVKFKETVVSL